MDACKIWICLKMVVLPHSPPPISTSCREGVAVEAPHPIGFGSV